jgi:hypothetical protein
VNELVAFQHFLASELENGSCQSLDEIVARFRAYQDEASGFRKHLKRSIDQAEGGEADELDYEALKGEIRDELAEEGVTD